MTNLDDEFGCDHASLPSYASGNEAADPAANAADHPNEWLAAMWFQCILGFLYRRRYGRRCQRFADTAGTTSNRVRLICHALAAILTELPHPVAMILPNFRILPVPAIRFPPLLSPAMAPAFIAAIALPAITGTADEKHLAQPAAPQNSCRNATSLAIAHRCGMDKPRSS
jgi:hypothetical protein